MAKITVVGQAVVVTSAMKLEDIKKVAKYRPEALILKGGEDNKEDIFRLGVGTGSINKFGASFDKETRDEEKLAVVTMTTTYDGAEIKDFVADELGAALINLGKLEAALPAVIEEIDREKAAIMESITLA